MTLTAMRMLNLGDETAFNIGHGIDHAKDQGTKVIRLNLGEPDFDSPSNINQAPIKGIEFGDTHYCDHQGVISLRKSITRSDSQSRDIDVHPRF